MKVTPIAHGLEDLLIAPAPGTEARSDRVHMSTLYNALYQELEPRRYGKGGSPDVLRLSAGLALEEMLEAALRDRLSPESGRPGEFVSEEGIAFTPDLIIFNGSTRVGEIKLSWLSTGELPTTPANYLPPKFNKYVTQIACYCRALETPYARLYFFGVNGNYAHPFSPQLLAFDLEFTRRELDDEWASVLNHARRRRLI